MAVTIPTFSEKQLNEFAVREWSKTLAFLQKQFGLSEDDCKDVFQEAFLTLHNNIVSGKLVNLSSSIKLQAHKFLLKSFSSNSCQTASSI